MHGAEPEGTVQAGAAHGTGSGSGDVRGQSRGRKTDVTTILVVDDEAPIRELLAWMLKDLGYQVEEAINGREAIALAERHPPDLVITDVMMPVMGGHELCRWVKEALEPAPAVILTSSVSGHVARGTGADAFVLKPFDLDELEAAIRLHVTYGNGA